MAGRRIQYLSKVGDPERPDEKARIAAQCRLAELLVAHPEEIVFVIGYLTHASMPGVIDGITGLVRDRVTGGGGD